MRSRAESETRRIATLPGGPVSDCPVNVTIRDRRSVESRPRVIGWSTSPPFVHV